MEAVFRGCARNSSRGDTVCWNLARVASRHCCDLIVSRVLLLHFEHGVELKSYSTLKAKKREQNEENGTFSADELTRNKGREYIFYFQCKIHSVASVICNGKFASPKIERFPRTRKRAFRSKASCSLFLALFLFLFSLFIHYFALVKRSTLLAERFLDFTNDLRQFCEIDARRSPYGTVLIATPRACLFTGWCITERTMPTTTGWSGWAGEENVAPFFRSTRIHPPRDASVDTSTVLYPARPSTNSLTDSWPHLQCIEKRGGVRSIRAACLARPGPARYWILRGRLAARHVVSDRRSARTERHVARFNF